MDKLKMQTKNKVDINIEAIGNLFPNTITEVIKGYDRNNNPIIENVIDFDMLKQELSNVIVEGREERYQMNWPGKKEAILKANSPINKTLRPCREESVNFDTTENLYIEGDNLEVLKLLQETYLNKVKMIYIDPPYNTGNDSFVYNDNFTMNNEEFSEASGQYDEDGNINYDIRKNNESNGRFHSDWLNMMYPRLKIAKDLLRDDGVIFISIDDNEVENLKKICNEIFGENNFIADLIWRKKTGASDAKGFSIITEYILVYCKNNLNIEYIFTKDKNAHDINRYKLTDEYVERRGKHYIDNLDRGGIHYSDSLNYPIKCPDGKLTYPNGRTEFKNDGWTWTWGKDKFEWGVKNGFIEFRKSTNKDSGWSVCYKNYLYVNNKDEIVERGAPHKNMILEILNTSATLEIKKLFNNKVFQYTKPVELIRLLLSFIEFKPNDVILDFFSGSSTTAHAVMQLNADDNISRKFIMVQLPEKTEQKSEAFKAGYKNICEIGKERIRRAGRKIKEEHSELADTLDTGFRVLKLDSSNMKDVYYNPLEYSQNMLEALESNIKSDRTSEDLLFQVMLELGELLSADIQEELILGKKLFNVGDGNIIACFDDEVTNEVLTEIAKMKPLYAVFRDSSLSNDSVATNFEQIFNTYSPDTIRKVL